MCRFWASSRTGQSVRIGKQTSKEITLNVGAPQGGGGGGREGAFTFAVLAVHK